MTEVAKVNDIDPALLDLLRGSSWGALITLKRSGRPQLSNVVFALDPAALVATVSVTDDRAKTKNLRRDPRASLYATLASGWGYAVAEGTVTLSEVTTDPGDDAAEELVRLYRSVSGEHPDWDEYRAAMIAERRLVVRLAIERLYGMAGAG